MFFTPKSIWEISSVAPGKRVYESLVAVNVSTGDSNDKTISYGSTAFKDRPLK